MIPIETPQPGFEAVLGDLVRDTSGWPRDGFDPDRVALFMERYREDGPGALPPIEVAGYVLTDGWHRSEAALRLGWTTLPAAPATCPDGLDPSMFAFIRGLETAAVSAKPLSRAERRRGVLRLLDMSSPPSDREIGRLTGLSHQTVGRVRERRDGPMDRRGGEPEEQYLADRSASAISDQLVRGLARAWEARGVTDLVQRRMPRTLADALRRRFGDAEAGTWATRLERWAADAARQLDGG